MNNYADVSHARINVPVELMQPNLDQTFDVPVSSGVWNVFLYYAACVKYILKICSVFLKHRVYPCKQTHMIINV